MKALAFNYAHHRSRIEELFTSYFDELDAGTIETTLLSAVKESLLSKGKRLRPCLVYVVGGLLGADYACLDGSAAAVECIHTYSLIHDDLPAMDNDSMRRGRPSCHIAFGEAIAILAGDALQPLATLLLLRYSPALTTIQLQAILREVAESSGLAGMCSGQAHDILTNPTEWSYQRFHDTQYKKTGLLLRASVRCALIAANETRVAVAETFDRFGLEFGLAFQLQDDIADYINPRVAEKGKGANGVAILGLKKAQQAFAIARSNALTALKTLPFEATPLVELLDSFLALPTA